jgi:catechol 2,3-dioxygenase-like lactoylglutathione lyase family enzyme
MNLNHLDIPVSDIAQTRTFFERYFGFKEVFSREDGLTVLLDEDGFALTLSPLPEGQPMKYPVGFHVGFNVDCEDDLFEAHRKLVTAGVPIVRPVGDLAGAMTFHCHAPGPLLVEVACRPRS